MTIRLHRYDTAGAAEAAAAETIAAALWARPRMALGLATGRSMIGAYRRLAGLDAPFGRVATFNLDEYCGLAADHPASFRAYMEAHLFSRLDAGPKTAHFPLPGEEAAFERAIAAYGGLELQLLGIGRNGHIGFNEPGSPRASRTRQVALSASTLAANATDFPEGETPPEYAVTMGIGTILEARRIILLATGASKAEALRAALEGPVSETVPASFLQGHPSVEILCDAEAAARLSEGALHA